MSGMWARLRRLDVESWPGGWYRSRGWIRSRGFCEVGRRLLESRPVFPAGYRAAAPPVERSPPARRRRGASRGCRRSLCRLPELGRERQSLAGRPRHMSAAVRRGFRSRMVEP